MKVKTLMGPVAGVDYPANFGQFQDWFATDEACFDYLAKLRWPDGFVCPMCAGRQFWRTSTKLWMCRKCSRRTSVSAGTIFEGTRSPLRMWFAAVWFAMAQKNGVSTLGLQRVLGLKSYETAWAWMHKLRRAMVIPDRDMLTGVVEVDETFVGGISRGQAGRSSDKIGVMVAAEMVTIRKLGRVRLEPTPTGKLTLVEFTQRVVSPSSQVKTDGARELRRLSELGYDHKYFTQLGSTVPAHVDLPGVHMVASLLKRWLTGTLHYGASSDHLAYYLDEFVFRFNRRTATSRGLLFYRLLEQAVNTSLSSCLCKSVSLGLGVGVDAVGVGDRELGEGLFPVRGDLALDEAALGVAFDASWTAAVLEAIAGPFVLDVSDRELEQLHDGVIGGEMAAVLDDLP